MLSPTVVCVGTVPLPSTNSSSYNTSPYKAPDMWTRELCFLHPLLLCPHGAAAVWTQALCDGCLRGEHAYEPPQNIWGGEPQHLEDGGRHIHTSLTPCTSKLKARCGHCCCTCGSRKKKPTQNCRKWLYGEIFRLDFTRKQTSRIVIA